MNGSRYPSSLNQWLKPLNQTLTPLIKLGVGTPLNLTPGLVVLEVEGRKTKRQRTVPLVGYFAAPYLFLGTVRPSSQWIKNLALDDAPHVWVWGQRRMFRKTLVTEQLIVGRIVQG